MTKFGIASVRGIVATLGLASAIAAGAQTVTILVKFDGSNGAWPLYGPLLQGTNGNFIGTTSFGGAGFSENSPGDGTVFQITPKGKVTTIYSFCSQTNCSDGAVPYAGLAQGSNGNFYGTTFQSGANGDGTVFELSPTGQLNTLHNFCSQPGCADGLNPVAGLVLATNGNFYGTTSQSVDGVIGTIFELTPSGEFTTVFSTDGPGPSLGLIQAINGNFYGVTQNGGGAHGQGSVFEIGPNGKITTLFSFNKSFGANPNPLIQAADGNFYGTTSSGGANDAGTVFELTPDGEFTLLYSFCAQAKCADGAMPYAPLVQGTDGNFYGTTLVGGANSYGTIFEIMPGGALTSLYSFCAQANCADGELPYAGLMQGTDGNFYGTTHGGANCPSRCGSVFSLSMGLGPFVEARPAFGKAGRSVDILGNNLAGATSVSFNGTPAEFTVASNTYIKATVPTDATNGPIQVVTPSGTLSSNVGFQVEP
jgi:uncharacterized repeat protein (TIGR03803 family)